MNRNLIFQVILSILILTSCGSKQNNTANSSINAEVNKPIDSTTTGTIEKMWWGVDKLSIGGIVINGKTLSFSTDYLGENSTGRIFITPESSKDVLFLDKKKPREKLNTKYLDKKVKVTYDANRVISKLEKLGEENTSSAEPKTNTGFITDFLNDHDGGCFITLKNDNGEVKKLRLFHDEEGYNNAAFSVFFGQGEKKDYVFYTKNYSLALIPDNTERKVIVTTELKTVESIVDNGSSTLLFNDNAATQIKFSE